MGDVDSQFILGISFDGSNLNVVSTNISGSTIGIVGATATVIVAGDARTYTFTRNAGNGFYSIKASSVATGTTILKIRYLSIRNG